MRFLAVFLLLVAACGKSQAPDVGPGSAGTPRTPSTAATAVKSSASGEPSVSAGDPGRGEMQRVSIRVTAEGFVPKEVHVVQGRPATLELTREVESECLNAVRMPWMSKAVDLPLREKVFIQIPDMSQDGQFEYACWMNMVFGKVVVDPATPTSPSSSGG